MRVDAVEDNIYQKRGSMRFDDVSGNIRQALPSMSMSTKLGFASKKGLALVPISAQSSFRDTVK